MTKQDKPAEATIVANTKNKAKCVIIMPISSNDDCSEEHWQQVLTVLMEVAGNASFDASAAWVKGGVEVIHKKILENIVLAEVAIVDVSTRNPNVMFELGVRLAMNKPTIIVSDSDTEPTFDAGLMEHIFYPRSLNIVEMRDFMNHLKVKLIEVHKAYTEGIYESFLQTLGPFEIISPETKSVSENDYMLSAIQDLSDKVDGLSTQPNRQPLRNLRQLKSLCSRANSKDKLDAIGDELEKIPSIVVTERPLVGEHYHLDIHGNVNDIKLVNAIVQKHKNS